MIEMQNGGKTDSCNAPNEMSTKKEEVVCALNGVKSFRSRLGKGGNCSLEKHLWVQT